MKRDLKIEKTYPHPPARVWKALTDPQALAAWLMPNDFKLEVGHRFTFQTEPAPGFDGIVNCEVLEFEAESRLAYTWKGGPIDTVLSFSLEDATDRGQPQTRLTVEQTGFEGFKAVMVSFILGSGNKKMYDHNLPKVLDDLAAGRRPSSFIKCDDDWKDDPDTRQAVEVLAELDKKNDGGAQRVAI